MIETLLLPLVVTVIILVLAGLVYKYAIAPAPVDAVIKWLLSAVGVVILAVVVLRLWGVHVS